MLAYLTGKLLHNLCMSMCVCVCERERERERWKDKFPLSILGLKKFIGMNFSCMRYICLQYKLNMCSMMMREKLFTALKSFSFHLFFLARSVWINILNFKTSRIEGYVLNKNLSLNFLWTAIVWLRVFCSVGCKNCFFFSSKLRRTGETFYWAEILRFYFV